MKLSKSATELRELIKAEASRSTTWPKGADVLIWPDGSSWKAVFVTIDLERDKDLEFRVSGLSDHLRERIDLAANG